MLKINVPLYTYRLFVKRINNIIEHSETGRISLFEISEKYFHEFFAPKEKTWVTVSFISCFQECNVYTNKGTILTALQKVEGSSTFPIAFDLDKKRLARDPTGKVLANITYDNYFNCHGFTFLNGKFWFLLDNAKVETILRENNYQECDRSHLQEGGICLYYNSKNELIHSGKMLDGIIQSKFGVNTIITRGEPELIEKYSGLDLDMNKTKYYNLGAISFGGK